MSLHLTDGQLRKIQDLQQLLVAPLRFPDLDSWCEAVQEAVTNLFGVERSLLILPTGPDDVRIASTNLGSDTLRTLERGLIGTDPEVNRYRDAALDRVMGRLAAAGVEVWNRGIAERVSGVAMTDMPRFYEEVVRTNDLEEMLVMAHSLQEGRAMLSLFSSEERGTSFGSRDVDVFRLLLPSFRAGTRACFLVELRTDRLGSSLNLLGEGVAIFRERSEIHRNRALRRLLAAEENTNRLTTAIAACAERITDAVREGRAPENSADAASDVSTPDNRYHLAASHLGGGESPGPVTVLVVIRPAVPPLPDEAELRNLYGLTPRQAEVATLLARGHSNRVIADRLTISPHTARHHAQRVLEKTGARSRKALALQFLEDSR